MAREAKERLVIETVVVDLASAALKKIDRSVIAFAKNAVRAMRSVKKSTTESMTSWQRFSRSVVTHSKRIVRGFKAVANAARIVRRTVKSLIPGLGGFIAAAIGIGAVLNVTRQVLDFERAMAEVATITDTGANNMDLFALATLELARAFGLNELDVAKAQYQAISSGIEAGSESTLFMADALKLATAGLSTAAVSVDVLTSIMNAYGDAAGSAADISDLLFVTIKRGKTTLTQIGGAIGDIVPVASAFGVKLEEVFSLFAAITKSGASVNETATQIKQVFVQLGNAGSAASKGLKKLGLDVTAARIETDGLLTVFSELATLNITDLTKVFGGNVRALLPVLSVTGPLRKEFESILKEAQQRAGVIDVAFLKQVESRAFQVTKAVNAMRISLRAVGNEVINGFLGGLGGDKGLEDLERGLSGVALIAGSIAGEITKQVLGGARSLVQFIDTVGGIEVVAEKIVRFFRATFKFVREGFASLLDAAALAGDGITAVFDTLGSFGFESPLEKRIAAMKDDIKTIQGLALAANKATFGGGGPVSDASLDEYDKEIARIDKRRLKLQGSLAILEKAQADVVAGSFQEQLRRIAEDIRGVSGEWFALSEETLRAEDVFVKFGSRIEIGKAGEEISKLTVDFGIFERIAKNITFGTKTSLVDKLFKRGGAEQKGLSEDAQILFDSLGQSVAAFAAGGEQQLQNFNDKIFGTIQLLADAGNDSATTIKILRTYAAEATRQAGVTLATQVAVGGRTAESFREMERAALKYGLALSRVGLSQEELTAHLREFSQEGLNNLTNAWGMAKEAALDWADSQTLVESAVKMTQSTLNNFGQGMGTSFAEFVTGAKSAEDAIRDFAIAFLESIAQMAAQAATMQLLSSIIGSFVPAAGGISNSFLGGGSPSIENIGAPDFLGGGSPSTLNVQGNASGGGTNFTSGLKSISRSTSNALLGGGVPGYAMGGGPFSSPHMAVIGEGKFSEFVVPTPDGRSIPIKQVGGNQGGGQGTNVNLTIVAMDSKSVADALASPEAQTAMARSVAGALNDGSNRDLVVAVKGASK